MTGSVQQGAVGVDLIFQIKDQAGSFIDLVSNGYSVDMTFKKPSGALVTVLSADLTPGTNNYEVVYTTQTGFLDEANDRIKWMAQARVYNGVNTDIKSQVESFLVVPNL